MHILGYGNGAGIRYLVLASLFHRRDGIKCLRLGPFGVTHTPMRSGGNGSANKLGDSRPFMAMPSFLWAAFGGYNFYPFRYYSGTATVI